MLWMNVKGVYHVRSEIIRLLYNGVMNIIQCFDEFGIRCDMMCVVDEGEGGVSSEERVKIGS